VKHAAPKASSAVLKRARETIIAWVRKRRLRTHRRHIWCHSCRSFAYR
jgi:hypothetical protein